MSALLDVVESDITTLALDAIVNAANEALAGGGGVDGAIHRAAGAELIAACRAIPMLRPHVRCPTGEARLTPGFRLPAKYIVHTVGPIWHGGRAGEPELLAACYRNSLALARDHGVRSIAFPAISCGVFGYPLEKAVAIAVREVRAHAAAFERVVFCCFGSEAARAYRAELGR